MIQWELIGDCTNSFDEDGNCLIELFSDVSDFACSEESAEPTEVNPDLLPKVPGIPVTTLEFTFDIDRGVLFGYDQEQDVHYFFKPITPRHSPAP